ncbi:hypothetical protein NXF25_020044 [Crotalus adamanteus]|uniref:Uncharacterized protein n=1 Tax=Crotalus adamanteus TaxID=8729 RepID=A0AAW1B3Y3_CROAD
MKLGVLSCELFIV